MSKGYLTTHVLDTYNGKPGAGIQGSLFKIEGENKIKLEKEAVKLKLFLESKINGKILGPVSAPIFKIKKKYRIRLLIRGPKTLRLQNSLAEIIPKYKFLSGIKLLVDVDPISFN